MTAWRSPSSATPAPADNRPSHHSAALVLHGDACVGKSALLPYARSRATGTTVLPAAGIEAERNLSYAGLRQLLRPIAHRVDALPAPQAAALRSALLAGHATMPDPAPVDGTIERVFLPPIDGLSVPARALLVVAAAENRPPPVDALAPRAVGMRVAALRSTGHVVAIATRHPEADLRPPMR